MTRASYMKAKGRGKLPPFVGLPNEMIDSDAFRDLKAHAVKLLVAIARSYYGWNNGSLIMPFAVATTWGFTNERTYTAALRQLQEHGFIEMTRPAVRRGKPMAARWAITWQPIDEPVPEHPHDAAPTERASHDWRRWAPSRQGKVPGIARKSTGKSAGQRPAKVPVKSQRYAEATGKSASQKPVFDDSRQAEVPADLISTRGPDVTTRDESACRTVGGVQ